MPQAKWCTNWSCLKTSMALGNIAIVVSLPNCNSLLKSSITPIAEDPIQEIVSKMLKQDLSIDDFISNIFFSKGSLFKFHCYSLQFDVTLQTHLGNLRVKSRNFSKTYAMKCSQFRLLGVRGKEVYLASCTIPQDLRIFLEHTGEN